MPRSVTDLLRRAAAGHPERIAVDDCAGLVWTYAQLAERTFQAAGVLQGRFAELKHASLSTPLPSPTHHTSTTLPPTDATPHGVDTTTVPTDMAPTPAAALLQEGRGGVALLLEEGPRLILAQLAASAAGLWFTPLDPQLPVQRVAAMMRRLRIHAFIVDSTVRQISLDDSFVAIEFDDLLEESNPFEVEPPHKICYVQHTSGTTGIPKPVVCSHEQIVSYGFSRCDEENISENSRILMSSASTFDPYQGDVIAALCSGAALIAPPRAELLHSIGDLLHSASITHVCASPSLWSLLPPLTADTIAERYPLLNVLSLGGEKMPSSLQALWSSIPHLTLYNLYGVTECTVYQMRFKVSSDVLVLGSPMKGVDIFIDDIPLDQCTIGDEGELVIGGSCVSTGYVGDGEGFEGGRYRSGDRVRYSEEGVELLGRKDAQMKVNGIRIEPGEIEHILCGSRFVHSAAVVSNGVQLVAHIVPNTAQPNDLTQFAITQRCKLHLPIHMVPRVLMTHSSLPLTTNGKVDRHLLTTQFSASEGDIIPLRGALEILLASVWESVLGVVGVNAGSDWHLLGGTSILAVVAVRKLRAMVVGGGGGVGWAAEAKPQKASSTSSTSSTPGAVKRIAAEASGDAALFLHNSGLHVTSDGQISGGDAECFMGMCDGGTYAPCKLLDATNLRDYAVFLSENGVRVGGEENQAVGASNEFLNKAARTGRLDVLEDLVRSGYVLPNPRKGLSLLHIAAGEGHDAVVAFLLLQGLGRGVTPRGATACHLSAAGGHAGCLSLLLTEGNAKIRDSAKQTVLHYAVRSGQNDAVDVVLNCPGVEIDAWDSQFRTPLHWAVLHRHAHMVARLISAGCKVAFAPIPPSKVARKTRLAALSPVDSAAQLFLEDKAAREGEEQEKVEESNSLEMLLRLVRAGAFEGKALVDAISLRERTIEKLEEKGLTEEAKLLKEALKCTQLKASR